MGDNMHWRTISALAVMMLLAASPALAQGAAQASTGPFESLRGSWTGSGVVSMKDGARERVRCKATYDVDGGGSKVSQELRCASDAYKFDMNSSVVQIGGTLSGIWSESTNRLAGKITGRATEGGQIDIRAEGDTFTALLAVKTRGDHQTVLMQSPGSKVSEVSITLNRSK
jgi:hypothetical protein